MRILIIDGHGGKMGRTLVERISRDFPGNEIMAVGTNSTATAAMVKGGAEHAATGENALLVACRKADIIIGPIGIVIADSIYGEVTPTMAIAAAQADAVRILIPVNKCDNLIAGIDTPSMSELLNDVTEKIRQITASQEA